MVRPSFYFPLNLLFSTQVLPNNGIASFHSSRRYVATQLKSFPVHLFLLFASFDNHWSFRETCFQRPSDWAYSPSWGEKSTNFSRNWLVLRQCMTRCVNFLMEVVFLFLIDCADTQTRNNLALHPPWNANTQQSEFTSAMKPIARKFIVLYTNQKIKKRKTWKVRSITHWILSIPNLLIGWSSNLPLVKWFRESLSAFLQGVKHWTCGVFSARTERSRYSWVGLEFIHKGINNLAGRSWTLPCILSR